MPQRLFPALFFLWLACLVNVVSAAPLDLFCEINGRFCPIAKVDRHQVWAMVEGKLTPVPREAKWRLEGDLRENARYADWSPIYSASRLDIPDCKVATTPIQVQVDVDVVHWNQGAHRVFAGREVRMKFAGPFLEVWPQGLATPGLVVTAWVLHGQVIQTKAEPFPATNQVQDFSIETSLKLTPAEATGQPVVLLWHDGAFVPVQPGFASPKAQAAFHAVETNDVAALQAALRAGLKPWSSDRDGGSLLYYAAEAGQLEAVDALLAAGAKPNNSGRSSRSALAAAVSRGRLAVVDRLLAAKADPDGANGQLWPLALALNRRLNTIALSLVAAKARLDQTDSLGREPLIVAMDEGMADVATAMMARNAPQDSDKTQAARVLITQAKKGHTAVVRLLLQQKVKPDVEFQGSTALIMGANTGDPALAKALIAAGASPSQASASGLTPLMAAADRGQEAYTRELLAAGANPNAAMADGWTALHFAAQARADAVATLLLARGAKADAADHAGTTPLQLALIAQARDVANTLAANGAKLDLRGPLAADLMEAALTIDADAVVRSALADGWSANTMFRGEWPALRVADEAGAKECASLLRAAGAKEPAGGPPMVGQNKLDAKLRLVKAVKPDDPRELSDLDVPEQTVEADLVIDRSGEVRFPRLVGAPDPALAMETLRALRQWVFAAPLSRQVPVAIRARVPVVFAATADLADEWWAVDREPEILKIVRPTTPWKTLWDDFRGQVRLRFIVTAEGRVTHIRVKRSQHPEFADAAVEAAAQWVFRPAELDGKPVAVWMERSVDFAH